MEKQDVEREIKLYEIMDQHNCDMDTAELLLLDMLEDKKEILGAATPRKSK
jgi:hypothetical protein